jgi:hypothetical protein
MSSVLITFQRRVGIKNGLSCAVSTGFQLSLYQIRLGRAARVLFLGIYPSLLFMLQPMSVAIQDRAGRNLAGRLRTNTHSAR